MVRVAFVVVALVALALVANVVQGQSSFWCDGGEQQERLYRSLSSLRYNDDFEQWSNSTGWAATVTSCVEVAAGSALFANCTALPDEGLYECAGAGVSLDLRAAAAVYPCTEVTADEGPVLYNCTLFEEECSTTVVSTGDRLCPCQWFGVDCDSATELVALDLSDNNLSIMLPDVFFDDIFVSMCGPSLPTALLLPWH